MSLKNQNTLQAAFSMSSMTDVIFLLLIFFMVTSAFVFPTAMEINLPEGTEQVSIKPSTRIYIDSIGNISASYADAERQNFQLEELLPYLQTSLAQDTTQTAVAIYADEAVKYGRIVDVLNIGVANGIKMVLATKPAANAAVDAPADVVPAAPAPTQNQ